MSDDGINDMMALFHNLSLEEGEYEINDVINRMKTIELSEENEENEYSTDDLSSDVSSLRVRKSKKKKIDEVEMLIQDFNKLEIRQDSVVLQRKDGVQFTFYWFGGCRSEAEPWYKRVPNWGY